MQQRQLLWLLGALVVLVGIAVFSGAFDRGVSTMDLPAVHVPADEVNRIVITRDEAPFTLEKQADGWHLTEPVTGRADSVMVAQLIGNLTSIELETIVSNSEDRYENYGVGEKAKRVDVIWPAGKKTLLIGDNEPDLQSYYIRLEGDRRVYLSNGRLNLPDDLDRWRDRKVLSIPRFNIQKAVVSGPASTYELTLEAGGWTIKEDGDTTPADSAKVAQWLTRFAPLNAAGYLDTVPAADLKAEATHQVHFSIPGENTETVWLQMRDPNLAVTATGRTATYRLNSSQLNLLVPQASSLEAGN